MSYEFLKENVKKFISRKSLNEEVVDKLYSSWADKFILENNSSVIDNCCRFLASNQKAFILNGFMGAGKTYILNALTATLNPSTLVFKMNYFPATNLDDLLLSLFSDFSTFYNQGKIVLPKITSQIFSDKIHAFIKSVDKPMLFILDSFDVETVPTKIQNDIIDFVKYLVNFDKIKVIIASRNFDEEDLDLADNVDFSLAKMLDKEHFAKLLTNNNINENMFQVEQVFKYTKGHYLYASMTVGIISLLHLSLPIFLAEFTKKEIPFPDFLVYKILGLIPDRFLKLLCLLTIIRHGLNATFVLEQGIATKEDLEYLKSRMIISYENGVVCFKDYMKQGLIKSIANETRYAIHQYLAELYDSQLPKKPAERDLVISRATMRTEMEYHKKQLEKLSKKIEPQKNKSAENVDFSYLSYSKTVDSDLSVDSVVVKKDEFLDVPALLATNSKNNEKNKRFELSKEDLALLNSSNVDNSTKSLYKDVEFEGNKPNQKSQVTEKNTNSEIKSTKKTLEDYVQEAQLSEERFDFKSAINDYQKALEQTSDSLYEIKKPLIMTKLAICYKKNQDIDKALNQFEYVYNLYKKQEPEKANYILLSIAQIYFETYKFTLAKRTYKQIIESKVDKPPSLLIRALLDLAEIEDSDSDLQKAIEYCQKALIEAEKIDDLKLISESYFKYALFMDDSGKLDTAYKYYVKCIQTSEDAIINDYLSSAYSNLASILTEKNDIENAIQYYELAVDVDNAQNNYEGLYFGCSKLAHIYQTKSAQKALEYLVKALGAARRVEDNFYTASAYIDLGDFYYNRKIDEKALKAYIGAKYWVMKQPNEENIQKVNKRISDLKLRLGNAKFNKLVDSFKKK